MDSILKNWKNRGPAAERLVAEERVILGATEFLHEAMDRRKVTRAGLAKRLGVSASEITQRLTGHRNLSLRTFATMLHELGFGIEARLVDRTTHLSSVPLQGRSSDWPNNSRPSIDSRIYRTSTTSRISLVTVEKRAS